MSARLAAILRAIADRLHPQHEIVVHVRPVLLGHDGIWEAR